MRRSAAADVARPAAEKRPVRVVTIVNPAAGDGVDRGRLMQIKQALYGPKFAGVYQTLRPGQAEEWARTFRREAGYVVVGGDGTIHEVLTGMDLDRQALSPAGGGRNNALVRDLGGRDLASAAAAAEVGRLIRADVISLILRSRAGRVRRCRAASHVAAGYPALAVERGAAWARSLGSVGSAVGAALAAFEIAWFEAFVRVDGGREERKRMTGLLLANTRYLGPFRVTPEASAADGRLDAWFLAAGAMKQTLHNLAVVTRTRFYLPAKPVPARRVSIRFARPRDVLVDGERYADIVRVEAALLRGGLRLYQPPAPGEEILP